jgi:hypothetical protein
MYINKVVFAEHEEVKPLQEKYDLISYTDYDTREILSDRVSEIKENLNVEELEEFVADLRNNLGEELAKALLNNTIDFVLVV